MRIALLLSLCLLASLVAAVENEILSGEEMEDRFRQQRREAAASFRVEAQRQASRLSPAYHQAAAEQADLVQQLMHAGAFNQAIRVAEQAYKDYPFAERAPEIAHHLMRIYAATGAPVRARTWLVDLWERYPRYAGIDRAMQEALIAAQTLRDQGLRIDHRAEAPDQVFQVFDLRRVRAADHLFRFLSAHADRQNIAPIATLGLARTLLAEGGKDQIFEARSAYDSFLLNHPQHPLVFEALIELAVSHLITYRGPRFDTGVLIDAAYIIDQAELYTQEQPERVAIIRHYRQFIRQQHQERDLHTAQWYHEHRRWQAARYYYQWAERRDPSSDVALRARQGMERLPTDPDDAPPMRIIDWIRR